MSGKSIVLVGNSSSTRKIGSLINSYDVVIRFNNFLIKGFEDSVGDKISFRCTSGWRDVVNRNSHTEISPFTISNSESSNFINYNKNNINPLIHSTIDIHKIFPEILRPSTGFSLAALFSHLCIPVSIYNFDGFKSTHYWNSELNVITCHSTLEYQLLKNMPYINVI